LFTLLVETTGIRVQDMTFQARDIADRFCEYRELNMRQALARVSLWRGLAAANDPSRMAARFDVAA
jgi:hypothetical protein